MKTIQVNIGLNNNALTLDKILDYIATMNGYRLMAYYTSMKAYKGTAEPTLIAMLEYKYTRNSKVLQDWENVASVMGQDCIAISTDYFEALAFNPSYDGEGLLFDVNQFEYMKLHLLQ